jgi:hypothetical protein
MAKRSHRVAITAVAAAVVLSACGSGGLSVVSDPSDLIRGAGFIDWEELPAEAQEVRPPLVEGAGPLGEPGEEFWGVAVVLPGSEPRRLLIAVWHNMCMPSVTVAALDPAGTRLGVSIGEGRANCGEALKMWPFEVTLNRDVDPAAVSLEVRENRPRPLAYTIRGVEWTLMARALQRACDDWPGGEGCPPLPLCLAEPADPGLVAALEEVFPTGVMLVESVPDPGLTSIVPRPDCLVMQVDYGVRFLSESVVGYNVWVLNTPHTYWFQRQDSVWVDVSAEEVGVTDTTAIP